jgi:hypothetical protein
MGLGAHFARLAEESFERHGDYEALYFEGKWHSSASSPIAPAGSRRASQGSV